MTTESWLIKQVKQQLVVLNCDDITESSKSAEKLFPSKWLEIKSSFSNTNTHQAVSWYEWTEKIVNMADEYKRWSRAFCYFEKLLFISNLNNGSFLTSRISLKSSFPCNLQCLCLKIKPYKFFHFMSTFFLNSLQANFFFRLGGKNFPSIFSAWKAFFTDNLSLILSTFKSTYREFPFLL